LGHHTDIFIYDPDSSENSSTLVSIDQLRNDFLKQIHRKPFEGRCRVFIITALEKMRSEQANILLKTLEEPPPDVIIILLAEQIDNLLDTIISRCQFVDLRPLSTSEVTTYVDSYGSDLSTHFSTTDVKEICRLARGRIGWASRVMDDPEILNNRRVLLEKFESAIFGELSDRFDLAKDMAGVFGKNRKKAMESLDMWLTWWRDALLIKSGLKDAILNVSRVSSLERIASLVEFQDLISIIKSLRMTFLYLEKNMNPGLVFDNLMLRIPYMR
jgi:DNA polymerase-3 subunit delta'